MPHRFACRCCPISVLICLLTANLFAQPPAAEPALAKPDPPLPQIADEPKTIDPATLMPPALAVSATHDFSDSSLREVVQWLQDEHDLVVLLDGSSLSAIGISLAEPISDRLDDAPIYLVLNRLRSLGVAWYFDDNILHITSSEAAGERLTTLPYHVGDLLDSGYKLKDIEGVVTRTIEPNSWDEVGGAGALNSLGDVLFVSQTAELQREVQGLLAALRKHGRQTFVNDPPQHSALREKLDGDVDVDFLDTPLETAMERLAEISKVDIRLDVPGLRDMRVREREPVTLKLADRKLETVLQAIVLKLDLTWILRDGVLWITSPAQAEKSLKTAVYDVRDLCRDAEESAALLEAITVHAEPSSWDVVGGPGAIDFAKPGVLVVTHLERMHMEVLGLLETYRAALRASKPRQRRDDELNQVVSVYYRLHANVANDLTSLLPKLVRPETWKSEAHPKAEGEIVMVSSTPELTKIGAQASTPSISALVISRAVLIIRQTRAAHEEIEEVLRRVESGDARMSGGFGGGGFGGGFF